MADQRKQVFAVVRIDDFTDVGLANLDLHLRVTVKEVLPTLQEAEAEVERLNRLKEGTGAYYFWQTTRYYPTGRKGSSGTSARQENQG